MRVGRGQVGVAVGLLLGAVLVVGCSPAGAALTPSNVATPATPAPVTSLPGSPMSGSPAGGAVALQASVTAGSTAVSPTDPITVAAVNGTLNAVTLVSDNGTAVAGAPAADGTRWTSSAPLGYGRKYTLTASASGTDAARSPATATATFTTVRPRTLTMPYLTPNNGDVVGVGQPIAIKFDEKIVDRQAAQQAITITTEPKVDGAFHWFNNQEVRWRPESHWAPQTRVSVDVNVYGRNLGNGTYGEADRHLSFRIGDQVISTVDDASKVLSVAVNGTVVKTMPTSMGKDSTPTEHGVFIIGDKHASMIMDSATFGVPNTGTDGYKMPVKWATRMSYGGIFVHAAPWSVEYQGVRNVSHGCLNMSTADAQWFYDQAKRGDLVIVKDTVGPLLRGTEGLGDWNIPWETWKAGGTT